MADPVLPEVPKSWSEFLKEVREVTLIIAAIVTAISAPIAGCVNNREIEKAKTVAVDKIDATAAKVDDAAVKADAAREVGAMNAGRLKNIESKLK